MRLPLRILALALAATAACAPTVYSLRTKYRAGLTVESRSPVLACELPAEHSYEMEERVRLQSDGTHSGVEQVDVVSPLPLRIVNRTDEVLTVEWERSAFVDAAGISHRVRVFTAAASRDPSAAGASPLDRPPPAVIAPGTRAEALVLPEPSPHAPPEFFLPPWAAERAPLRLVLSVSGSTPRIAECVVTAGLEGKTVVRNAVSWPRHGDACVPVLGCAEGLSCRGDTCVDPNAPALPEGFQATPARKRLFGESCSRDADCVQGFRCDFRVGTCQSG